MCRPLMWCVDRPEDPRGGCADWWLLMRAGNQYAAQLTSREPAPPQLDPRHRLPHLDPLDGDNPHRWLSIGQGIPATVKV